MKTKDKICSILMKNPGESVSGEKLAEECGVSRAAVWKAVNALRLDGFEIEGTTNGGYRLLGNVDFISEETIRSDLKEAAVDLQKTRDFSEIGLLPECGDLFGANGLSGACESWKIQVFPEIDSTNSYAKRLLSEAGSLRNERGELTESGKLLNNSIYVAEKQTAGRGRLGRIFYSPKKNGVYLSMIYAPAGGIKNPALITAFAAVAVKRAIKRLFNLDVQIKWINDIFFSGKKLCGILAEGITNFETGTIEAAVIGIGVNVFSDFGDEIPEEQRKIVTSIQECLIERESEYEGRRENVRENQGNAAEAGAGAFYEERAALSRSKLVSMIVLEFFTIMEQVFGESSESHKTAAIIQEYREASFLIGKEIVVHPIAGSMRDCYKAKVLDVDENASLVVLLADGSKRILSSGEVSIGSGFVEAK